MQTTFFPAGPTRLELATSGVTGRCMSMADDVSEYTPPSDVVSRPLTTSQRSPSGPPCLCQCLPPRDLLCALLTGEVHHA